MTMVDTVSRSFTPQAEVVARQRYYLRNEEGAS